MFDGAQEGIFFCTFQQKLSWSQLSQPLVAQKCYKFFALFLYLFTFLDLLEFFKVFFVFIYCHASQTSKSKVTIRQRTYYLNTSLQKKIKQVVLIMLSFSFFVIFLCVHLLLFFLKSSHIRDKDFIFLSSLSLQLKALLSHF